MPVDLEANDEQAPLFNAMFLAEITAVTGSSPYVYSWKEMVPDPAGTGYEDADPGRTGDADDQPAYEINDVELAVGTLVQIRCRGVQDGELRFEIDTGATGIDTGLTVKESDLSPSYSSITSLEIDQAQGGVVTQPGSGRAKVSWADATTSQVGVVNYGSQTFGGDKTFADTVRHEDIVYTSIGTNDVRSTNWLTRFESQRTSSTGSWNMTWTAEAIGGLMAFTGDVGVMTLSTTPSPSDPADSVTVVLDITAHANFTDDAAFSLNGVQGGSNVTAGLTFTGGLYMSGSYDGPTSIAGSGGTTGLTISGGPITSGAGTLTLGGTLVPANGGTGLTTTPADGTLLTGTGSGYAQTSALAFSSKWGVD